MFIKNERFPKLGMNTDNSGIAGPPMLFLPERQHAFTGRT